MIAARASGRERTLATATVAGGLILGVMVASAALGEAGIRPDFAARGLPPSAAHPFGTDMMGRDMLARTLHGLALSLRIGLIAAAVSVWIALLVAMASGMGRAADAAAGFLTDATLGMPHLMLLILVSFALGGGTGAGRGKAG